MHIAFLAAVALLGAGAYAVSPFLVPNNSFSIDSCIRDPDVVYHIHPRLSIFILGNRYPIPYNIGVTATCTRPVHTHDDGPASGGYNPSTDPAIIHVESPVARAFALADFFHVWRQIFTPTQILTYANDGTNVVSMTVNGAPSTAFGSLVFDDGQDIVITYGPAA